MYMIPSGTVRLMMMFLAGLLSVALLLPSLAFSQADIVVGEEATIANANGDNVLLRADPGYEAEVLDQLAEGTRVAIIDGPFTAEDGSVWYTVQFENRSGYIVSDFLTTTNVEPATTVEMAESESVPSEPEAAGTSTMAVGGTGSAVATTPLNMRAGPDLSQRVVTVIPAGASVTITGNGQAGFLPVSYNGSSGWASSDYLSQEADQETDSGATGSAQTTTSLNFRSGPDTGSGIIAVIPAGTTVPLTGQSQNGFVSITYNGWAGWVHGDYLTTGGSTPAPEPDPGPQPGPESGTARVTTSLHLRSGPSTADGSLLVMPAGASVTLTGNASNGFYAVSYNGTQGWAYADFLDFSGDSGTPSTPEPAPPATSESAVTTASLNMRNSANLSAAVILVIPSGASVSITGAAQDGFFPVIYSGQSGWASAEYLNQGGTPSPEPSPGTGGSGIAWPVSGGTWSIIQGYNGGTHQNRSASAQYYYALDIARADGSTAGQSVYAPASGTILWVDPGSGGIAIDMGNGYTIAMFHCTFDGGLGRGQSVQQGQYLGTISGPGGAGYASTPHIDMTLWQTGGGGRSAAPFTGGNAISGSSFPDVGGGNQHGGTQFTP